MALFIPCLTFAQLSHGEGESVALADKKFSCYLPKFFEVQQEPPGVIHKASGTFIIVVKVPQEKRVSPQEGLKRDFFEDPRYEILSLTEDNDQKSHGTSGRSWLMRYRIQGYEFERYTKLIFHGEEQFVVIGNYSMKLKDQVVEEVRKVMESFTVR